MSAARSGCRRDGEHPSFPHPPVTPLHGRTFAIWTSLTCVLCLLTAGDMGNRGLFTATFTSFAVAAVHFTTEWLNYGTMSTGGFAKPAPFALGSMALMLLAWP